MEDYTALFARHVRGLKMTAKNELTGYCPFHEDDDPSWSVNRITWKWQCFGCRASGHIKQFKERVGEQVSENDIPRQKSKNPWKDSTIVACYDYTDEQGKLLYQSVRFDPKDFRGRRPNGSGGWIENMSGVERVLYGLPELQGASVVYACEGEKDVATLRAAGRVATTIAGGTHGPLTATMLMVLKGKNVICLPDNDDPGREFMLKVSGLLNTIAATVKIVKLPDTPAKEDISWWLSNGHTVEELDTLANSTPVCGGIQQWEPDLQLFDEIIEKKATWLWYPYLPIGRLTILEGDPGHGKSWFSLAVATCVTVGGWIKVDEAEESLWEPSSVIYVTCEDDPEDTIKKRLRLLEADQKRVYYLRGKSKGANQATINVTLGDIEIFSRAIEKTGAKLLIVDPIQAYLPSGVEMNKAEQIRPVLAALQRMASEQQCAVLLVRHLSKGNQEKALYRGMGSIDFSASARSVLLCAEQKQEESPENVLFRRRIAVAQVKNNLAPRGKAIEFELQKDVFMWVGPSDITVDELLSQTARKPGLEEEARRFLLSILQSEGMNPVVVQKEARKAGITKESMEKAKAALNIELINSDDGGWVWNLPQKYRGN